MENAVSPIRLRGVRHNNLKNFDLDLPVGRLIVMTGLSGSGKSSLAFDTLFAEGQRRYIETFSPYARQFFDRMDKPQVDRIEGIPPAIAIEQRNSVKTTRSTVGTMTELCDYMKLLWPHLARLYCRQCGQPVRKDSPQSIWEAVRAGGVQSPKSKVQSPAVVRGGSSSANSLGRNTVEGGKSKVIVDESNEVLITFNLPLSEKLPLEESLALVSRQGYQRLLWQSDVIRLAEAAERLRGQSPKSLDIIQDRLTIADSNRARFVEACEHAYHFGKGRLAVHRIARKSEGTEGKNVQPSPLLFSSGFHCANCDLEYREPSAALFSFNNPVGACPTCRGFGRTITIDYDRALPDRSKTLAEGAIKPWQTGHGMECQTDLLRNCRQQKIPIDVPFDKLPAKTQEWIINGAPDYGKDKDHEWPRLWYGIKGYFRWLESKAYKMHIRVLLSRYRAYATCPDCQGRRFKPDSLQFKATDARGQFLTLADFYLLPVEEARQFIEEITSSLRAKTNDPLTLVLNEVRSRLGYLVEAGLGYLTLDRPTRSLSGGETERVNLTACLGTRLVNTLFVLDEPSVGLHARDSARLVRILESLRDTGNTVIVVEHEATIIRAADQVVDLGPGQGEAGGQIVFQGPFKELLKCPASLTGQYLSGRKQIELPPRRAINPSTAKLIVQGATCHNLNHLTVEIPLSRFVCLTGVSGSGKTTLAREVLLPNLEARLNGQPESAHSAALSGSEQLGRVVMVDQSPLGKTPRSNPVVYIGAFEDVRELFAQTETARQRGLNASAFSFNSGQGQCERCRGAGFEKIEMQFLSDVFIRCPDCGGRRYRAHILEVKLGASVSESSPTARQAKRSAKAASRPARREKSARSGWSIADLLDATVDDAIRVLLSFSEMPAGRRAVHSLRLLQEVGLGYLRLGQPINTLSGGESQRLKLVSHLAEFERLNDANAKPTLFMFDEPTTGLHFDDVRVLLKVFQRLVDAGHSLLVIEHNLEVLKCADWIVDLGPEAGAKGGQVVAEGAPEVVAACEESHTGRALAPLLKC